MLRMEPIDKFEIIHELIEMEHKSILAILQLNLIMNTAVTKK